MGNDDPIRAILTSVREAINRTAPTAFRAGFFGANLRVFGPWTGLRTGFPNNFLLQISCEDGYLTSQVLISKSLSGSADCPWVRRPRKGRDAETNAIERDICRLSRRHAVTVGLDPDMPERATEAEWRAVVLELIDRLNAQRARRQFPLADPKCFDYLRRFLIRLGLKGMPPI